MATTDPTLIPGILEALGDECSFAVLHGEKVVADCATRSDVDVVVDRPPGPLLARLHRRLDQEGILQLTAWNYDVGAWTTIWTRDPFAGGMQLDLMYDPAGAGRYGVRTTELLRNSWVGERYRTLGDEGRIAYLLQKRLRKGDWAAVQTLIDDWPPDVELRSYWAGSARLERADIERRLRSRSQLGRRLHRELDGGQVRRLLTRLARRTGVLVDASGHDVRDEMAAMGLFLIAPPQMTDGMSRLKVEARLRRPSVLLTSQRGGPTPDAAISGRGPFPLCQEIHRVWQQRLISRS